MRGDIYFDMKRMIHKLPALAVCVLILAAILSLSVLATDELPEGATITGHSTKMYSGSKIVDTNWAYYDSTKTLHFIGNTPSYNETGALENCDEGSNWSEYVDVIEHIIVGSNINKITGVAFQNYPALIDVRIEKKVTQIDTHAFRNCPNFSTLWLNGTDRIEGRIDASGLSVTNDFFENSAIKEIVLGKKDTSPIFKVPKKLTTLYASNITDELKLFANTNNLTLINLADMSVVDTNVAPENTYNPEGATVSGHSTKILDGSRIVNTNWAYYAETKTLHFIGNQTAYNETGALENCDAPTSWAEYKDEIEHIIVGQNINKITGNSFIGYQGLKDVCISAKVTQIDTGAFLNCPNFSTLWVEGTERIEGRIDATQLKSTSNFFAGTAVKEVVLSKNDISPNFAPPKTLERIYSADPNASVKVFAAENNLILIDLATMQQVDTNVDLSQSYKPEGATVSGHSTKKYEGSKIVDTYWAYYADTKTLEFVSNSNGYNETGAVSDCDGTGDNWLKYKDEIEHIIVGDKISKITGNSFAGYKSLIDVRLGKNVNQIDAGAFSNCTSLTTIWRNGSERIEGRVDLTGISVLSEAYKNTAIKEIVLTSKMKDITVGMPLSLIRLYSPSITEELKKYAEDNLCDLINLNDPSEVYSHYIPVDISLPSCGARCVFDFDESTGTLTIKGGGMIIDTVNYYGGGSKNSPFFSIKQKVTHIIIEDTVKGIGKYAFCQFTNLESVQIPDVEGFVISNAAFEKCSNLKSVYRTGTQPVEGTADLSKVSEILPWSFAYDYLIANIILGDAISEIGSSVFEENINLANIYGTPGSFAESYANENGFAFFDMASSNPEPIKCTPPENVSEETRLDETESVPETDVPETEADFTIVFHNRGASTAAEEDGTGPLPIIIVIAVIVGAALTAVIVILLKKKKK